MQDVTTKITGTTFQINNTKLYVPLVTFSISHNIKFLENIKQGFKRIIFWNKYRSEITTQTKNNNSDYLIDPTFRNIKRLRWCRARDLLGLQIPVIAGGFELRISCIRRS